MFLCAPQAATRASILELLCVTHIFLPHVLSCEPLDLRGMETFLQTMWSFECGLINWEVCMEGLLVMITNMFSLCWELYRNCSQKQHMSNVNDYFKKILSKDFPKQFLCFHMYTLKQTYKHPDATACGHSCIHVTWESCWQQSELWCFSSC